MTYVDAALDAHLMKIGIIGAGAIGATLAQRLSAAGHDVAIANPRHPAPVDRETLSTGAREVHASEVTSAADVVIVSVNLSNVSNVSNVSMLPGQHSIVAT